MDCKILKIILVPDFCPLKTEIRSVPGVDTVCRLDPHANRFHAQGTGTNRICHRNNDGAKWRQFINSLSLFSFCDDDDIPEGLICRVSFQTKKLCLKPEDFLPCI